MNDPRAVDYYGTPDPRRPYSVAGFYEYLSEQRAGATNHLEQHGATFISAMVTASSHFAAIAQAMGASSKDAVLDALRDFYATIYVRDRANAANLPFRFRILDEITAFDQQAGTGTGLLSWGTMLPKTRTLASGVPMVLNEGDFGGLESTDGGLYEISLPAGATEAEGGPAVLGQVRLAR